MKKIGDKFAGARVELVQMTSPTALTVGAMTFDQYGQPLHETFGKTKHSDGEMKLCWPPWGYTIILKAPATFDL